MKQANVSMLIWADISRNYLGLLVVLHGSANAKVYGNNSAVHMHPMVQALFFNTIFLGGNMPIYMANDIQS